MSTKKIIKRRRAARRFPAWAVFLPIVAIGVFGSYYAYQLLGTVDKRTNFAPAAVAEFSAPELQAQMAQYERKIYPYSIIPGGVRSREELSAYIRNDHVVAEHYSDFDAGNARITRAAETRQMYVSYRLGDKVYWTANRIRIPLGEILITDGTLEARARCGNMISDTQMTPLSGEEPDVEFFEVPQTASLDSSELEPFIEPGLTPLSQFQDEEVGDSRTPLTGEPAPPVLGRVPLYPIGSRYLPSGPVASGGNPPGGTVTPGDTNPPGGGGTTPPGGGGGNPPGGGGGNPPGGGGGNPPGGGGGNPPGGGGGNPPGGGGNPPDINEVPEPGTLVLALTGLAIAVVIRIRQRKQMPYGGSL